MLSSRKVTAAKWPNELDWKKVGTYFGIVPQSNEHQANNLSQTEKIVMDMWWKDKVYNRWCNTTYKNY